MKIFKSIINIILILIIFVCGYKVFYKVTEYKKADEVYEKIATQWCERYKIDIVE